MRRALLVLLTIGSLLLGSAGLVPASTSPPPADAAGLHVLSSRQLDPRLLEVEVATPALAKPTSFRVLLPAGYDAQPQRRYPSVYLLHGGGANYRWWTDIGRAAAVSARTGAIIVMPDGGRGGWYSDWFNFGAGGPPRWEHYHVEQLIPFIDANFRTTADRAHRSIAGLSMGGFGALSYAARHPERFGAAASFSGAVDTNHLAITAIIDASPLIDGGPPSAIFGPRLLNDARWRAHNPVDLAERLRGMRLDIFTGNGHPGPLDEAPRPPDVTEAVVHDASLSLSRKLNRLDIAHGMHDYGPGTHTAAYWTRDLTEWLPSVVRRTADPAAGPIPLRG